MSTLFPLSFVSNPSFLVKTLSFYWLIIQQNIIFLDKTFLKRFPSFRFPGYLCVLCTPNRALLGKTLSFVSVLRHFPAPLVLRSCTGIEPTAQHYRW